MNILIVDGWTQEGNAAHVKAGCVSQAEVFDSLIKVTHSSASTTIVNTYSPGVNDSLDLTRFDAVVWTGGGGNIYENNRFNRDQLKLCERALVSVPYLWGSCWGLQVVATVMGGQVAKAKTAEIGLARDIVVGRSLQAQSLFNTKPAKFDAPAHHVDEIARLPSGVEVLAENSVTMQAIAANNGKIVCTQYHPEIPYAYLVKLLVYWTANYQSLFTDQDFEDLLSTLTRKDEADSDLRTIEFDNWLTSCSKASAALVQ